MTDPSPQASPAQRQDSPEAQLFRALCKFQADSMPSKPVAPRLPAVLAAASAAFEAGLSYTATRWHDELTVTLGHCAGGELGSSAPWPGTGASYSATVAQLLAGLLGIPLADDADLVAAEAPVAAGTLPRVTITELQQQEPPPIDLQRQGPAPAPAAEPTPEPPAAEPDEPAEDPARALTEQEIATAVDMVKAMTVDQRRVFVAAYREAFAISKEVKQITGTIREAQHLHFIDRFTTEAAGGVAP